MIGPEVETRTIFTKLIADLIASLHSLISPLLAIVDSVGAITCYGARWALTDIGSITDTRPLANARSCGRTACWQLCRTRIVAQELCSRPTSRTSGNAATDVSRTRPGACTWFQIQEALQLSLTGPGTGCRP
jgi:hypothetical protein